MKYAGDPGASRYIDQPWDMLMCVSFMGDGVRLARMTETPTLHLTVGLPGVGKIPVSTRKCLRHEVSSGRRDGPPPTETKAALRAGQAAIGEAESASK